MSRVITRNVRFPIDGPGEITPCTEKQHFEGFIKDSPSIIMTDLDSRRRHCKNEGLSMTATVHEISGL